VPRRGCRSGHPGPSHPPALADRGGTPVTVACKLGLACGRAFAAEIGKAHGQREFNVVGDTVNTAAHLMSQAATNQILLTEPLAQIIAPHFDCESLAPLALKGKDTPTPVFALRGPR